MSKVKIFTTLLVGLTAMHSSIWAEDTRILTMPSGVIEFGNVKVNETKTKSITISNEGNATLNISGIRLHNKIKNYFSISNWSGSLAPSQTLDINITFIPTENGLKQGLIYIDSDKTNRRHRGKLIRGTGTPELNTSTRILRVCEDGAIDCIEAEAGEEFGNVQLGTSTTRNVTIYNDGNSPLTVRSIYLHQKIKDVFTINNPEGVIIPAGGHHDISVTYTPNDIGVQSGNIYFVTNKTSGFKRKDLIGTGVSNPTPCSGAISIKGSGDYGLVPKGNSASKTFRIENLGTNPLTVSRIYLHPRIKDAFTIDGNTSNIVIPGRGSKHIFSENVTINYNSVTADNLIKQGLFYVSSSSCKGTKSKLIRAEADENSYRILNFRGIKNFESIAIGSPVTKTLSIVNDGNSDLSISNIYLHPRIRDSFEIVQNYTLPLTIAPNSSRDINVTYTPTSEALTQGLIYVKSDHTNRTDGTMVLRGTVVVAPQ